MVKCDADKILLCVNYYQLSVRKVVLSMQCHVEHMLHSLAGMSLVAGGGPFKWLLSTAAQW